MFIAITVILLAVATMYADGCMCAPGNQTYADWVCKRPMVIRAFILRKNDRETAQQPGRTTVNPVWDDHSIEIRTITVFRNVENASIPTSVRTPGTGGMCGVEFTEDQEYLILGSSQGSEILTRLCHYNSPWRSLDRDTVQGLESGKFVDACKH